MTVEEAALLHAIAAVPGEVTARLAYADWLDEHGRGIEAAWVREEGTLPPRVTRFAGGFGNGGGHGRGVDYGHGYVESNGEGRGYGEGYGEGEGEGYGEGEGEGDEDGDGYCQSDGYGDGHGGNDAFNRNQPRRHGRQRRRGGPPFEPHITHAEVHVPAPGEYVIVRSRDQGCVCGEYRNHHAREVALSKARQIYSWADKYFALIDFAVIPGPCRLSREAPGEVVMLEACGIIRTTPEVEAFLRAHPGG